MTKHCKPQILKYTTVKYICSVTLILNVSLIFYAIDILIMALNLKLEVGNYINLITDNEGNVLPSLLALPGVLCLSFNSVSIYLLYNLFSPEEKPTVNNLAYAFVMSGVGSVFTMLIVCVTVLAHAYSSHQKLHDGIQDAMHNYSSSSLIKSQIDMLQIQFQCCGSKKYDEWYQIKWYDEQFEKSGTNTTLGNDQTPFSCCSMKSIYPCIHHGINSKSLPYRYSLDSNMSISTNGCFTAIKAKKKSISRTIIATIFVAIFLQILMLIGMRFIQTAHYENNRFLSDLIVYRAWLFGCYVETDYEDDEPPPIPPVPTELMD